VVTHVGTWQRVAHLTAISQLLVELLTERSFTMPHTKRQLDALNRILVDLPDDGDGMLLSEFDGFVASLIVCPELISPSEWIPAV
jgi:hypothetical protein